MKEYDFLIVGSGLYGATFAHLVKQDGKRVLVIDKRPHLGGNIYCENIDGVNVHKYGAHIFHTNNKEVWDFVNTFVDFNRYTNSPIANFKGKLFNLPFNMNTFHQMWNINTPEEAQHIIEQQRNEIRRRLSNEGIAEPRNLEEQALMLVGTDIYETLIKGYTEKQWGRKCTELPAFIIKRLPVRFVFDNNYFNDRYQGIPIGGYNKLIEGLLAGVEAITNIDFFDNRSHWENLADKIIYTGQIDEFFNYQLGHLEYRSVRFEQESLNIPNYQGNAVVNYTDAGVAYTRIIEHKHFEMFGDDVARCPHTVISKEYSTEWHPGIEPYYPINNERNSRLYEEYKALSAQRPDVLLGGRLAEYRYYDMAPTIEQAMSAYKTLSKQ